MPDGGNDHAQYISQINSINQAAKNNTAAALPGHAGIEAKVGGDVSDQMVPKGNLDQHLASPGGIVPLPSKGFMEGNILEAVEGNMAIAGIERDDGTTIKVSLSEATDAAKAFSAGAAGGNLNASEGAGFGFHNFTGR